MDFWSPIGDSPFGNWLPKGHQLVTQSSLVMLISLLTLPFCFDLEGMEDLAPLRLGLALPAHVGT